jgi:NADH dehydrogenase FAD-containing subunit
VMGEERARVALVTGGGEALEGAALPAMRRAAAVLARRRITVIRDRCEAIEARAIQLSSGARLACDAAIIATGAEAPNWLADSGLALDEQGFIGTNANLQSSSHAEVFAVGDVATRSDIHTPLPRNGVQAVRAGPALANNLRRFVGGGALAPHPVRTRALNLLACGDKSAIAVWGDWTAQGRWVWWWKDQIDRRFVAQYLASEMPTSVATAPSSVLAKTTVS